MKIESDNQLLANSIKDKDSLQIKVDEINKNIKESAFSLKTGNLILINFCLKKIELDKKEIELENQK